MENLKRDRYARGARTQGFTHIGWERKKDKSSGTKKMGSSWQEKHKASKTN